MYASIRRGKANPGSVNEGVRRAQAGFAPIMRNLPGFVSYSLVHLGNDEVISITIFETQGVAEESNSLSLDWDKQNVADILPEPLQMSVGEVLLYETK